MTNKAQIKFQIRYLKAYLKHSSFVLRENKTVSNVQARLSTEWYKVMRNISSNGGDRDVASRKLNEIEAEMRDLYKSVDMDARFNWSRSGEVYQRFPNYVHYEKDGKKRTHHIAENEKVTAAHILYNKLRHKKHHLKDESKEHEYIHTLTYWTERLAFLYEEECANNLSPKDFISQRDGVGECRDGSVGTASNDEGRSSHE